MRAVDLRHRLDHLERHLDSRKCWPMGGLDMLLTALQIETRGHSAVVRLAIFGHLRSVLAADHTRSP